ncbi:MAG: hypothetical protein J7576_12150 [Siphonobacter aquaeclarae]|nr:hypothetical protein [Siphonobacter aquaeclarae]
MKVLIFIGVWLTAAEGFGQAFRPSSLPLAPAATLGYFLPARDSIVSDTLYEWVSGEGYPLAFFRKIRTSVCFDNQCRLLRCAVYWNPTGRFLGLSFPPGEYLSKAEHKPFTPEEYERLLALLADPSLPLKDYTYDELVPRRHTSGSNDADGVTSATAKNVLEYVVEGAAFTTYKLWHVVYGSTQSDIDSLVRPKSTAAFLLRVLDSPDVTDRLWALNQVHSPVPAELWQRLTGIAAGSDYTLAETAVQRLPAADLATRQGDLLGVVEKALPSVRKQLFTKLKEAKPFTLGAPLATRLLSVPVDEAAAILDLLTYHRIDDPAALRAVSQVLGAPNAFLARKAAACLTAAPRLEADVQQRLARYRSSHR